MKLILSAFQPVKDEFGVLPVFLVIDPSTFHKMWAVPNKEIFFNLQNLRTSWYQLHSFGEVFSQRSECSYDPRPPGRPWFSHSSSC